MVIINTPLNQHTSNIVNGLAIFIKVCPMTKIIPCPGAIDVVLLNSTYSEEELSSLVLLKWQRLTDYSWRYTLENPWVMLAGKYENDPQFGEVLEHIKDYRKELDEIEEDLWEKTYSLDFRIPWTTGNNPKDLTEEDDYYDGAYQIVEERMYDQ